MTDTKHDDQDLQEDADTPEATDKGARATLIDRLISAGKKITTGQTDEELLDMAREADIGDWVMHEGELIEKEIYDEQFKDKVEADFKARSVEEREAAVLEKEAELLNEKKKFHEEKEKLVSQVVAAKNKSARKDPFNTYKDLPPTIIDHLKLHFGDWLNFFPIKQEYREDFGGPAICITVPDKFSTYAKEVPWTQWSNETKKPTGAVKVHLKDERWCSLRDPAEAKKWILKVKDNIITQAHAHGLRLPSTNTGYDKTLETREEYERSLAGGAR